jgi:hypothetical protein
VDGSLSAAQLQGVRGWTDEDWEQAADRLRDRGWVDAGGAATPAGRAVHQSIEDATDRAAARPWARLGEARTQELAGLLAPVAMACAEALPYPNPVGLPRPIVGTSPAAGTAPASPAPTA